MLADACAAALHSLRETTLAEALAMVNKIFESPLAGSAVG